MQINHNRRLPPNPSAYGASPASSAISEAQLRKMGSVKYTCLRLKDDNNLVGTLPDYSKQFGSSVR